MLITLVIAGCADFQRQPPDFERLANISAPKTPEDQDKTCAYLRSEIAQLWNIANSAMSPAMYPFKTRLQARTTVSDLESKAAEFECGFAKERNRFDI